MADDGSCDQTSEVVAQFASQTSFPVHMVTHPHAGFHPARCRNEGARATTAPLLLFLDGDCLLPADHLQEHLAAWRPGRVTFAYCLRLTPNQTQHVTLEAIRGGQVPRWVTPAQRRALKWQHAKATCYQWIRHPFKPSLRGGNLFLSREDFERVNGFDESFQGWGGEDDDLGRRLRAAGIRPRSITGRTCTYHLWHPKVPSYPRSWKEGLNVSYLLRPGRLTRCLRGLKQRTPGELIVRLSGSPPPADLLTGFLSRHGWRLAPSGPDRADVELVFWPSGGKFHQPADCRVLVVLDEARVPRIDFRPAHAVLSPRGALGRPDQARLKLDDVEGLWAWLGGSARPGLRAAA